MISPAMRPPAGADENQRSAASSGLPKTAECFQISASSFQCRRKFFTVW